MRAYSIMFLVFVALSSTGCEPAKEVLGFNRTVNDEFAVAATPALTDPPNFLTLPEPTEKYSQLSETPEATQAARDIAFSQLKSDIKSSSTDLSSAEVELLKMANVGDKDPEIRRILAEEKKKERKSGESFVKDLLLIKEDKGDALDPRAEAERLKNE